MDSEDNDAKLIKLLSEIGEAIIFFDHDGVVRYCNDVYLRGLGLTRSEVIGRKPAEYCPASQRSVFYNLLKLLEGDSKPVSQIGFSAVLNRWFMARVFPVQGGAILLGNDATESIVKQHMIAGETTKDSLTGLPNKVALWTDMEYKISEGKPFTVLLIGLERFHVVTNSLGHSGGDHALMEIASKLQYATNSMETLYRFSTTKFIVLAKGDPVDIGERYKVFKKVLENPFTVQARTFVMSAFSGMSRYPQDGASADGLLKCADLASIKARELAMAAPYHYEPGLEAASLMRAEIEMELRDALDKGVGLHLVFQPKGDLISGETIGAEALIRWNHPDRGYLSPAQFLKVAQDCNLMKNVDNFVLRESLKIAAVWSTFGLKCPISINVSSDSLSDPSFLINIKNALKLENVDPRMFEIEIPEGSLIVDMEASVDLLTSLSKIGVSVSVDDFGTGYSSFSYLSKFPLNTLKIDRSFVAGMDTNPTNTKIVRSIIKMAHSLDLHVVAEGVETIGEMGALKLLHCNSVQGYYYGKPMKSDDFIAFAMLKNAIKERMSAFSI